MKKTKQQNLNKIGVRILTPTAAKGRSIAQNLTKTARLVREAVAHDAVSSGGCREQ